MTDNIYKLEINMPLTNWYNGHVEFTLCPSALLHFHNDK